MYTTLIESNQNQEIALQILEDAVYDECLHYGEDAYNVISEYVQMLKSGKVSLSFEQELSGILNDSLVTYTEMYAPYCSDVFLEATNDFHSIKHILKNLRSNNSIDVITNSINNGLFEAINFINPIKAAKVGYNTAMAKGYDALGKHTDKVKLKIRKGEKAYHKNVNKNRAKLQDKINMLNVDPFNSSYKSQQKANKLRRKQDHITIQPYKKSMRLPHVISKNTKYKRLAAKHRSRIALYR